MGRFDAILWDVDGTLLDFLYAQRCALSTCLQKTGQTVTEEILQRYSAINDGYWKRYELGEVTKEQLLTGRFASLFEEYHMDGMDAEAFAGAYEEHLGKVYRCLDDSFRLCKDLSGRIRQYVITNGVTAVQESKLRLSGLGAFMDDIFISERVGIPKPQKGFFDYCMSAFVRAGFAADRQRLLIVGDSLSSDIKGGVLYGIPTCWYRPDDIFETGGAVREVYEQYRPDYEISHLSQIYQILGMNPESGIGEDTKAEG